MVPRSPVNPGQRQVPSPQLKSGADHVRSLGNTCQFRPQILPGTIRGGQALSSPQQTGTCRLATKAFVGVESGQNLIGDQEVEALSESYRSPG